MKKKAKKITKKKPSKPAEQAKSISGPTLVAFLLDETGSMSVCKQATISGFNEYIQTLKGSKHDISFTLTKFNSSKKEAIYDCVDIKKVKELNDSSYTPENNTPLYDAIGATIKSIESNPKSKKTKTLVVIQTDGEENDSHEFTREKICDLIKQKEKQGWTFVFLGANVDAYKVGASIGVKTSNTANYSVAKTGKVFNSMAVATMNYASTGMQGVTSDCFYTSAGIDVKSFVDDDKKKASGKDKQLTLF